MYISHHKPKANNYHNTKIQKQQQQDGLAAVLPQELLPLFTEEECERLVCGVREVDVDLLRQCTECVGGGIGFLNSG